MRRKRCWITVLVLALLLALLPVVRVTRAATCTVTNTNDSGSGSLRWAIEQANSNSGPDTIAFNIPASDPNYDGVTGVWTIKPGSSLPDLTDDGTTVNGYSQSEAAEAIDGTPAAIVIQIDGSNAGLAANGLTITSSGNVIKGLAINHFLLSGIDIHGSGTMSNTISGNYIGTDASGTADQGNNYGVYIWGSVQNNTIGGDSPAERNVISGNNAHGVCISGDGAMGNTVSGNYIGTNADGTGDLGNGHGVYIWGGAQNNTIGGGTDGERNVISGNDQYGVCIGSNGTLGNVVSGNYIGINAAGTAALGNDYGVYIEWGAHDNVVGGDTPGERNVISGNGESGVRISNSGTMSNTVSGNYIGTDYSGTAKLGNAWTGVYVGDGARNNTVGGDTDGERNVISGNDDVGVRIIHDGTTGNVVLGNYIGANASGTDALGNRYGVYISDGAQNNVGGGDTAGARNVISGNDWDGVVIASEDTTGNVISGNYIGANASGTGDLGNGRHGVHVGFSARNNAVGGNTSSERNVISGNGGSGVHISGSGTMSNTVSSNYIGINAAGTAGLGNDYGVYVEWGAHDNVVGGDTPGERNVISGNHWGGVRIIDNGTTTNTISGNAIGTDASGTGGLGNGYHGVSIAGGARSNTIGPGNVIAYNDDDGVKVDGNSTTGNAITQNSIFSNTLGISLTNSANGGIVAPVIATTTLGSVNVVGTACANCTVEAFASGDTDGEGETYVGSGTADASGDFTVTVGGLGKPYLTATATDPVSGTSEFSAVFTSTVHTIYLPLALRND